MICGKAFTCERMSYLRSDSKTEQRNDTEQEQEDDRVRKLIQDLRGSSTDFTACFVSEECGYCQAMEPVLNALLRKTSKLRIIRLNRLSAAARGLLKRHFVIDGVPT